MPDPREAPNLRTSTSRAGNPWSVWGAQRRECVCFPPHPRPLQAAGTQAPGSGTVLSSEAHHVGPPVNAEEPQGGRRPQGNWGAGAGTAGNWGAGAGTACGHPTQGASAAWTVRHRREGGSGDWVWLLGASPCALVSF